MDEYITRIDFSNWDWRVRFKVILAVFRGRAIRIAGGSRHTLDCACTECGRFDAMRWD